MSDGGSALEALRDSVDRLAVRAEAIEARMRSQTRALWWAIAGPGLVIACVVVVGMVIVFDNRAQLRESDQRWCRFVGIFLLEDGEATQTERGRRIAAEAATRFRELGCGPEALPQ